MVVTRAPLTRVHPVLEIRVAPRNIGHFANRVGAEWRATEVGVQEDPRRVHDPTQLLSTSTRHPRRCVGDDGFERHRLSALDELACGVDGVPRAVDEQRLGQAAQQCNDALYSRKRSAWVDRHGHGSVERRAGTPGGGHLQY
jgi:hypothetical protein